MIDPFNNEIILVDMEFWKIPEEEKFSLETLQADLSSVGWDNLSVEEISFGGKTSSTS